MYDKAHKAINRGLGRGARIVIGSISILVGLGMLAIAPDTEKAFAFHVFAGFCLLIALTCFSRGRVRQFIGSIIGCTLFLIALYYLGHELLTGPVFSSSRSKPSIVNAALFFVFIGLPGVTFAWKTQFGFRTPHDAKSN